MNNDEKPGALTEASVLWYIRRGATPRALETAYRRRTGLRELIVSIDAREEDMRVLAERWGIKHNGATQNDEPK